MSNVSLSTPAPAAAASPNVDFEVLRAQLVNCTLLAAGLLGQHNPGVTAHCVFTRFMGLGVLFLLRSPQFEERRYLLRLTNPDGTQANLVRIDGEGAEVQFDEIDSAYLNALGQCLEATVQAAWKQMVPVEPKITHTGTNSLH
jgi:hypothetical protein